MGVEGKVLEVRQRVEGVGGLRERGAPGGERHSCDEACMPSQRAACKS